MAVHAWKKLSDSQAHGLALLVPVVPLGWAWGVFFSLFGGVEPDLTNSRHVDPYLRQRRCSNGYTISLGGREIAR